MTVSLFVLTKCKNGSFQLHQIYSKLPQAQAQYRNVPFQENAKVHNSTSRNISGNAIIGTVNACTTDIHMYGQHTNRNMKTLKPYATCMYVHCWLARTDLMLNVMLQIIILILMANVQQSVQLQLTDTAHCSVSFVKSLLRLTSRKLLRLDLQPVDIKSRWRHNWKSAQVVNSHLVCDPTIRQLGFDLPWQQWSLLNRFCTEQGHCSASRRKWRLTDTDLCPCGKIQMMSHIVESCPLTKLNGGLSWLHSADKDAVQ